jgi:hypothetical protein
MCRESRRSYSVVQRNRRLAVTRIETDVRTEPRSGTNDPHPNDKGGARNGVQGHGGDGDRHVTLAGLRTNLVILTCAISAGIHGALVRDHFQEGTGAGLGFAAATILLAFLAVVLTRGPTQLALVATAAVFAGLIASYALVLTTGFPVLHPEPEAVDGLALFTKAIEVVGLVLATSLLRRPSLVVTVTQPKGTLS